MFTDNLKLKPKKGKGKQELEGGKGASREERGWHSWVRDTQEQWGLTIITVQCVQR